MQTLKSLTNEIETVKDEISSKESEITNFELEESEYENQYDDFIDEITGDIVILGMSYQASRALKELDPIAYNCGLSDYVDGLDKTENSDYQELEGELEALESQLDYLESELENLENGE